MAPLDDIAIYDIFNSLNLSDEEIRIFGHEQQFICELYHDSMNNYKPPHTSRICLNITSKKTHSTPSYYGSICHSTHFFNHEKYFSLNKKEKYQFLLNYIYTSTMKLAEKLNWNKEILMDAYNLVLQKDFLFKKEFPSKFSPDRKKKGQAILEKTELSSTLSVHIFGEDIDESSILIQKSNTYPLDSNTNLAKKCKWIDNNKFGYQDLKTKLTIHYNCLTKNRFRNMKFWEENYENIYPSS